MVPLGAIALIERNTIAPQAIPAGTPYVGLEHIERGGRLIGHEVIGDFSVASSKFRFGPDHILYGKLRPNLGKITRPSFGGVCSTDILPIRPGSHVDRDYLAHYLAQPRMIDHAASRATLEVIELTGRPFSATLPTREFVAPTVLVGLRAEREVLDVRIGQRARGMWHAGLVEEVRTLEGLGLREGRTASRAVGYAQALRQLDGELTQDEAIAETVVATRRLARRQERWFGGDPRVVWLEHDAPDLAARALEVVRAGGG